MTRARRRRLALVTTESDDSAIPAAAIVGEDDGEERVEQSRRDRDADGVVAEGEGEVLADVGHGGPGDADGGGHPGERAGHQGDVGGLDGDVRPGPDGEAHVGSRQGGGVVDAVADHPDPVSDENSIRPAHATNRFLSMSPPRRVALSQSGVVDTAPERRSCARPGSRMG